MTTTEQIITVHIGNAAPAGQLWIPVEGEEVGRLLGAAKLSAAERTRLAKESLTILGRTVDPANVGSARRAGLVVGGVQSGKTLSFTSVMALAKDNGFQLVVLIAGTKENLLEQSRNRLGDDLGLAEGDAHYRWVHHKSPQLGDAQRVAEDLRHALTAGPGDEVPTVLITVMKQHTHMANAAAVLRALSDHLDMERITALVIDDEADQASPNLKVNDESTTYRNLREIREALPRHTLLEYTATPQAPLLMSIADELSPDFTWVLTPGDGYTGGKYFFEDHVDDFLRLIPAADLACLDNPDLGPPPSLLSALALYFVGATAEQLMAGRRPEQRSMLVHPSQATGSQADFKTWVDTIRETWLSALRAGDADAAELCADILRPQYDDLARTVGPDMPPWEDVLNRLPTVMGRARIEEVNSRGGKSRPVDWVQAYAWILVGGALMDRGFTVEGLTVTYMPRGLGIGNADTLQQRGRFFGYKRSYAGFCRAWLEADVADAFTNYVLHEQAMQDQLQQVARNGEDLKQWRRRFLLDPSLRLTRQNVSRLPMSRAKFNNGWFHQWHVPLPPAESDAATDNQQLVSRFLDSLTLGLDSNVSGPTFAEMHDRAELTLADAYAHLLVEFTMVEGDQGPQLALLLSIEQYLAVNPDPGCVVYNMSQGRLRNRSLAGDTSRIKGLMQGRSRTKDGYCGDREVRDANAITIQIHHLDITTDDQQTVVRSNVPFLAISVPDCIELAPAMVQR